MLYEKKNMIRLARNGGQGEREGQERDCGKFVVTPLPQGKISPGPQNN